MINIFSLEISYYLSRGLKKIRGSAVKGSSIHRTSKVESGSTVIDSVFGRYSFCGYDCTIVHCDVGSFCSLASKVSIGGAMHPMEFVSTSPVFLSHRDSVKAKLAHHKYLPVVRTTIGHDVWIGEGVYVKAGVTVGHGAVIGMGSVVTKDVPPYSVVAGNPARLIRMRFEAEVMEALMKMAWWDLPDAELTRLGGLFNRPREMLIREGYL